MPNLASSNLPAYSYAITQDLSWQDSADWQIPDTPFMSFAFWQALSDTDAIGDEAGWLPLYIIVSIADSTGTIKHSIDNIANVNNGDEVLNSESTNTDKPVAVMPVFIKGHHQGEYVFDHSWAQAYAHHGEDYYPRLVTSVPYTPVTGQRLWLADGVDLNSDIIKVALYAVDNVAKQIKASSWHGLFVNETMMKAAQDLLIPDDQTISSSSQLMERQGNNFLWHNHKLSSPQSPERSPEPSPEHSPERTDELDNYDDIPPERFISFDEFLATLTAKKRKNIRAERKKIPKQNLTCRLKLGAEITAEDWHIFYQCYAMTYAVRGRQPYLSEAFFIQIGFSMPEHLMLAQGLDEDGEIIAGSLFFYDTPNTPNATLYGRYWGALAEYDSLHFELCYYQGLEFAIAQGLDYFDPGTQGKHKLIRGFVPTKTHSLHRIFDERFAPAIADFCKEDRAHMREYRREAHKGLPFNIDNMPEFKG